MLSWLGVTHHGLLGSVSSPPSSSVRQDWCFPLTTRGLGAAEPAQSFPPALVVGSGDNASYGRRQLLACAPWSWWGRARCSRGRSQRWASPGGCKVWKSASKAVLGAGGKNRELGGLKEQR